MKGVLFVLILFPVQASAFLFGMISEKKAGETLSAIEASFSAGDCVAVAGLSEELFREKPSSLMRARAYSYLGRCYEAREMPDKAMIIYKLAHGLYPEDGFFSGRLAAIYLKAGFPALAAPLFEQVLRERSDDIEANTGLARAYAALGFLSKAKSYYSRAVILGDFGDLGLLKEYTAQMLRKRDWEEAELIIGYALRTAPKDAELRGFQARAAAGRGRYEKAAAYMREGLELAPGEKNMALELALLELLAGDHRAALAVVSAPGMENNALAALIRGMAFRKTGDPAAASANLTRAAGMKERPFVAAFAARLLETGGGR